MFSSSFKFYQSETMTKIYTPKYKNSITFYKSLKLIDLKLTKTRKVKTKNKKPNLKSAKPNQTKTQTYLKKSNKN